MYHRQRFPIVVNMGNGLGQSLFLRVTQEDWSASRTIILSKLTVVSSFEEWSILEVGAGQSFPLEMVRTVIP
jgi:hypothetical protein